MANDFVFKDVPAFGKRVHRLGLATTYGIDEKGIRASFERGMNYVFWNQVTARKLTKVLKGLPAAERDKLVIATGPTLGFFGGSVRRGAEAIMKKLKTDHLDVFQLMWLGTTSAWT